MTASRQDRRNTQNADDQQTDTADKQDPRVERLGETDLEHPVREPGADKESKATRKAEQQSQHPSIVKMLYPHS
jgi:hypothetical protein